MRLAAACALGLSAIFAPGWPAAAAIQTEDENWRRCVNGDADVSLGGCSAIIQSGATDNASRAIAYYDRGIAHRRSGDVDLAIQDYDQAIRLKPDFVAAFNNRGVAYYAKSHYDRAIQDYDQAIRLKPNLAEAFNNRCLAYLKKVQYDRATLDFNQTIRLNKDYGNAMVNRELGPVEPPVR